MPLTAKAMFDLMERTMFDNRLPKKGINSIPLIRELATISAINPITIFASRCYCSGLRISLFIRSRPLLC